ncbi:hypothetical protein M4D81_28450 [Paenibacillus sp. p3-SID867]|nr:hypothetical protein [Paenibacillus sp. p3-SID867]
MSAGAFGVLTAVSSLSGVVANSFIGKYSDRGLDRKLIIILATISSALGYISYLVFDNFLILLIVVEGQEDGPIESRYFGHNPVK